MQRVLIRAVAAGALAIGLPAVTLAQPPTPPEIVRKIDRHTRHAVAATDRAVRRATSHPRYVVRHHVYRVTPFSVRALCNDGRYHEGRTATSACWTHGGYRG